MMQRQGKTHRYQQRERSRSPYLSGRSRTIRRVFNTDHKSRTERGVFPAQGARRENNNYPHFNTEGDAREIIKKKRSSHAMEEVVGQLSEAGSKSFYARNRIHNREQEDREVSFIDVGHGAARKRDHNGNTMKSIIIHRGSSNRQNHFCGQNARPKDEAEIHQSESAHSMRSKKRRDHSPPARTHSNGTQRFPALRSDKDKHGRSSRSSEGNKREDSLRKISQREDGGLSHAAALFRDKEKNERNARFRPENETRDNTRPRDTTSRYSVSHSRQHSVSRIRYRKLEEFSMMVPDELVHALNKYRDDIKVLLHDSGELKPDWVNLLIKIFANVCQSTLEKNAYGLISLLPGSMLIRNQITLQIQGLNLRDQTPETLGEFINDVILMFEKFSASFPSSCSELPVDCLIVALNRNAELTAKDQMLQRLNAVVEIRENHLLAKRQNNSLATGPYAKPQNDFRSVAVIPTIEEIWQSSKTYIRPIKERGKYSNGEEYLDIQFRLLREDFIAPLREGIHEISRNLPRAERKHNIKMYKKVQILDSNCSKGGLIHKVKFDVSRIRKGTWIHSRRLIFGTLLCLSEDNFETFLFATVANRDIKELEGGQIDVHFISDLNSVDRSFDKEFVMIESPSYYQAYCHVLEALKNIKENGIPCAKYIVSASNNPCPPKYLQPDMKDNIYDLRGCVTSDKKEDRMVSLSEVEQLGSKSKLNTSQLKAFKEALTREFVVIQGPPGTGKTFLGLKIADTLLKNVVQNATWGGKYHDEIHILIVCYTNHALDQFVEGLINIGHENKIIRIGGRSQNEAVSRCNIFHKRGGSRGMQPNTLKNANSLAYARMKQAAEDFEDVKEKLALPEQSVKTGKVLPVKRLLRFMPQGCQQWFANLDKACEEMHVSFMEIFLDLIPVSWELAWEIRDESNDLRNQSKHSQKAQRSINDASSRQNETQARNSISSPSHRRTSPISVSKPTSVNPRPSRNHSGRTSSPLDNNMAPSFTEATQVNETANEAPTQEESLVYEAVSGSEEGELVDEQGDATERESVDIQEEMTEADLVDVEGEAEALIDRWVIDENEFARLERKAVEAEREEEVETDERFVVDINRFHVAIPVKEERKKRAIRQLKRSEAMEEKEVQEMGDPWGLSIEQRWQLYKYLTSRYLEYHKKQLIQKGKAYDECCSKLNEIKQEQDEFVMRRSKVIAMTTTCAARYQQVLGRISPEIVIIEEAAEVLEAHLITSLTEKAEHVILIGDHKQLKPKPSVFKLAKQYRLDLSLFERMINNGMECHSLDVQHRMRPEIACLVQDIYPQLNNHPSVEEYPDIKGVSSNVFFIDHAHPEEENLDLKSQSNVHEAEYITALCKYLILQGYSPARITVLTPYVGQLLKIRKLMPREGFEGVRVVAVDNYQGEENDIVLLSLVRSNDLEKVGFIGDENRVCVMLSRAKHGLYVIGNFSLLASKNKMWSNIVKKAKQNQHFGKSLSLFCKKHPETHIDAAVSQDFNEAPEGGCRLKCNYRLECGHTCQRACHPDDLGHDHTRCIKPCDKYPCPSKHRCRKQCHFGRDCGPCLVIVEKTIPTCGHKQHIPCHIMPANFDCQFAVIRVLECSHHLLMPCCEKPQKDTCKIEVKKERKCGHQIDTQCHEDPQSKECNVQCNEMLECGHVCGGTCSGCLQGRLHVLCKQRCTRVLICSHICRASCAEECPPCRKECVNQCFHSQCPKSCGEVCIPCMEKCELACKHKPCNKLCNELCEHEPCNKPCKKNIRCKKCRKKNKCIGLCGEQCPSWCRNCDSAAITEIFFGNEDEKDARFVELIDCNHIFEVQGLDQWMKQDDDGEDNNAEIRMKVCPKCRTPIMRSNRYSNQLKKTMENLNSIKEVVRNKKRENLEALGPRIEGLKSETYKMYSSAYDNTVIDLNYTKGVLFDFTGKALSSFPLVKYQTYKTNVLEKVKYPLGFAIQCSQIEDSREGSSSEDWICTQATFVVTENQVQLLERAVELINRIKGSLKEIVPREIKKSRKPLKCPSLNALIKFITQKNISSQQIKDADLELRRLTLRWLAWDTLSNPQFEEFREKIPEEEMNSIKEVYKTLTGMQRIGQEEIMLMKSKVLEVRKVFDDKIKELQALQEEREMIVKAVGLGKGKWYKCKNGHFYAIGECGGAMQESKCPECKETIGGTNHRLAEGNLHAGEFDGSRHAAWSEGANLANFNLDNLE